MMRESLPIFPTIRADPRIEFTSMRRRRAEVSDECMTTPEPVPTRTSRRDEQRWLVLGLVAALGCQRAMAPVPAAAAAPPAPSPPSAAAPARDAAIPTAHSTPPSPRPDHGGPQSPDGRPWQGAEKVDADVIRVTTLTALYVEANEIRCPHVIRSKSVPIQKDIGPWQLEGDLVETDALKAHSVSARLIIADEIQAMVVKKLTKPHRWTGAGGAAPVRNRVTLVKGLMAPSAADPVF
jgi:hypothetical protein